MKRTIFVCATILFALILTAGAFVPSKESTAKASAPQKGKQITTQVDLKFESAKDFDNFAAGRLPKPGEPIKGVGVIIQRRPGGSNMKLGKTETDENGKVTFVGLAPGNYSLTVQQLNSAALAQNNLSVTDNYEVEVTGAGLVGGTMKRSFDPTKKEFYEPPSPTAKTSATHNTVSIDFEIKGAASVVTTIRKAH
jgi:hypothetical protein